MIRRASSFIRTLREKWLMISVELSDLMLSRYSEAVGKLVVIECNMVGENVPPQTHN